MEKEIPLSKLLTSKELKNYEALVAKKKNGVHLTIDETHEYHRFVQIISSRRRRLKEKLR